MTATIESADPIAAADLAIAEAERDLAALHERLTTGDAAIGADDLHRAESAVRFARARRTAAERAEAQRVEQQRRDLLAALEQRLAGFDGGKVAGLRKRAADALDAYAAAMAAWNDQLAEVRDELAALGSHLPATVDTGSPGNGYGVTIGATNVPRQRMQTSVAGIALEAVRRHAGRAQISLDNPRD